MNGINNDRHFLWRGLVGPYWHAEVFLFGVVGLGALLFAGWKAWSLLLPVIESAREAYEVEQRRQDCERLNLALERDRQEKRDQLNREAVEARQRFLALPEDEQYRILVEEKRRRDESRRKAEEQYAEFLRRQEAELKTKVDEKARLAAIEQSPETKKKRALNDLTGGGR